jgi:transposase
LFDVAHQQLHAPIVLVWDGLSAHKSPPIREVIAARSWLRVYQLPAYAPELNPVEKVWSTMKRGLANHCARIATDVTTAREGPAQTNAIPSRPHRRLPHRNRSIPAHPG